MKDIEERVGKFLKENPMTKKDLNHFKANHDLEMRQNLIGFFTRSIILDKIDELLKEFPTEEEEIEKELQKVLDETIQEGS